MKQQLNEVGERAEVNRKLVGFRSLDKDYCVEIFEVTYDDGNTVMVETEPRRVDDY